MANTFLWGLLAFIFGFQFIISKKSCPPLALENVFIKCYGEKQEIPCSNAQLEGTRVVFKCQSQYRPEYSAAYGDITCMNNGEWNRPLIKCIPKCGIVNERISLLINDGKIEKKGGAPWHVAVYDKTKTYSLICGGTIVSEYLVVSAAHCFYNLSTFEPHDLSHYVIVVAKMNRTFSLTDSQFQQQFEIRKMYSHDNGFLGENGNYATDIIVLLLNKKIKFSGEVLPACVDWNSGKTDLREKSIGKVSGWGLTENDVPSEVLLTTDLEYFSLKTCMKNLNKEFKRYMTHDKFCAKSDSGSNVNKGDSGGGLLFLDTYSSTYFLRGIVSVRVLPANEPLSLFTDVEKYVDWISQILSEVERNRIEETILIKQSENCILSENTNRIEYIQCNNKNTTIPNGHRIVNHSCIISATCADNIWLNKTTFIHTCKDGKWYPELTDCSNMSPIYSCGKVSGIRHVKEKSVSGDGHLAKENWPWLTTFINGTKTVCMGSLFTNNWIVTTAYCVKIISNLKIKFAHLGDLHLNNDYDGTNPVDIPIEKTITHPKYQNYHYNIALVRLKISVALSKFIFPICLIENVEELEFVASVKQGIFVDRFSSQEQSEVKVDILDNKRCFNMDNTSYGYAYVDSEMCVDFCWGYSGSPFMIYNNKIETYFLIGQKSQGLPWESECSKRKIFYTKISYFSDWINNIINE